MLFLYYNKFFVIFSISLPFSEHKNALPYSCLISSLEDFLLGRVAFAASIARFTVYVLWNVEEDGKKSMYNSIAEFIIKIKNSILHFLCTLVLGKSTDTL